jgi:hypothetical protein
MTEQPGEHGPAISMMCCVCGGTGRVNKPRLFLSSQTGEAMTVLESGRCAQCRDNPGSLPGIIPPV